MAKVGEGGFATVRGGRPIPQPWAKSYTSRVIKNDLVSHFSDLSRAFSPLVLSQTCLVNLIN